MTTEKKKEKIKPIQICTSTKNTGQIIITALCDDGTIWWKTLGSDDYWSKDNREIG
jgi:hypothetical protein